MTADQFQPLTVRIKEACRMTGIGRSKLYELIADGEIEIVKVGAITLVLVSGLQAFLERNRGGDRATSTDRSGCAADPRSGGSIEPFGA